MKLHLRPAVAASLLVGTAAAQVNAFVFFPQDPERQTITCASYLGRPDWNRQAEGHQELRTTWFRGIGGAGAIPGCILFGLYHWVGDERLSTIETYGLVLRRAAAGGGPETGSSGVLLRFPNLTTPPSTNPNRGTWIMYDGFTSPLVISSTASWTMGIELPANPNWPNTDGHALFRADLLSAGTAATVGENHRLGAPNVTWAIPTTGPAFSTPWTYILGAFVTTPNLHLGGIDPTSTRLGVPGGANLSMNGLFPDISGTPRRDGLLVRFTDNLAPNGIVIVGGSAGFGTPTMYPPYFNFFHLHVPTLATIGFGTLVGGVAEYVVAMPGTIPPALVGTTFAFQGNVLDPATGLGDWTNAQATLL